MRTISPLLHYVRYERGDAMFLCERCAAHAVQAAANNFPPPAGRGQAVSMPVYDADLLDYRCDRCGVDCTYHS